VAEAPSLPGVQLDQFDFPEVESLRLRNGERWRLRNTLVRDEASLAAMFDRLMQQDEGAYDTETSGLHPHQGARICGHAFAVPGGERELHCFYVPVRHQRGQGGQLSPELVAAGIRRLVRRWKRVRGHHVKFDAAMARADDAELSCEWVDTSLEAVIYDENEQRFGMKPLTNKHVLSGADKEEEALDQWLRQDARKLGLKFKKRGRDEDDVLGEPTYLERFGYARSPIELCGIYACHDAAFAWLLHEFYAPKIYPQFQALYEREAEVARELLELEWWGLPVNVDTIHEAAQLTKEEVAYWHTFVNEAAGREVATDPDSLRKLLYTDLGMQAPKLTKSGEQASADKESRKLLAKRNPRWAPLLKGLDKLVRAEKLHSTYAGSWLKHVTPAGRVHSSYNQLEQRDEEGIPKTGRLASTDPNIQNVDKKPFHLHTCCCEKCWKDNGLSFGLEHSVSVRRYYTVPCGFVYVYFDLSQIEVRVLAWLTQAARLLYCYARDLDVHQQVADAVCEGRREIGKVVVLATQYGITEHGLAPRLPNYADDPDGAMKDAARFLAAYDVAYPEVGQFKWRLTEQMRRDGGMFVSPFGRPRRIPDIFVKQDRAVLAKAQRKMMSSIVSGSAADMLKEIIRRARDLLRAEYGHLPYEQRGRFLKTIHDENVYGLPIAGCGRVIHALHRCFTDWPEIERAGVPIRASVSVSTTTWEDKKDIRLLPDGSFKL
jgi:DNA polymerase-1